MTIVEKSKLNNAHFQDLMCDKEETNILTRFYDSKLKDMWDHNFSVPKKEVNKKFIHELEILKEKYNDQHIKVISSSPIPFLMKEGFEEGIILVMAYLDNPMNISNKDVTFKHMSKEDTSNDLIEIEKRHYGPIYGEDFSIRKMKRYIEAVKEKKGFDFIGVYLRDKLVCYCYTFFSDGIVEMDSLLTDENYRHNGYATSLIAYISQTYKCPICLNAADDDTPKEMYKALGFKEIYRTYEYLKTKK